MNNKELKEHLTEIIFDESGLHQHLLDGEKFSVCEEHAPDLTIVGWDNYIPDSNCRHLILKNKKGELIRYKVSITISDGRRIKNED